MVATTPVFRNIRIVNLTATAVDGAGLVVGLPESPVSDLVLENVRIKAKTGLTFANASSVALKNVQVKVERGAPILLDHANVGF
jgi:hypothetical protein